MLDLQKVEFMNKKEMSEIAPSIFTMKPSNEVTEKYTHIPTEKVIDDMELLGWGVVDVKQVKARTEKTQGVQKHLVVFRNNDVVINGEDGDTVFPQIVMTNSHDGKNAFQFTAGLFRMVCENGLVISEQMFNLAKSFLDIRVEGTQNTYDNQAIEDVLNVQRKADEGNMLWEVFNRIQENIIDGNFEYKTPSGKLRQARIIKNFKQDQDVNKKMFSEALKLVA